MPKTIKVQKENQWFQRAEVLKSNRRKRQHHKEFFVEGVRSINHLVANREWRINAFLYNPASRISDWARGILAHSTASWHLELIESLMDKLSDKEDTSELLAIVQIPPDTPERLPIRENSLLVVVDRPIYPGNLGTLIRSCDALDVDGLAVFGHAADLYDPRTIRSAAGSFFALPTVRIDSVAKFDAWLETLRSHLSGLQVIGTSARSGQTPEELCLTKPTLLLIGNETAGLCDHMRELSERMITIPMHGSASSLNLSCAATALLYEVQRQRGAKTRP